MQVLFITWITMANNSKQIRLSPDKKVWDWVVHKPWAERAIARTETKAEGLIKITQVARNQNLETKIQNKDWTIGWWNSYGKDPCPPRDKN